MSIYVAGFQSFLQHFVLAKLATSSILVDKKNEEILNSSFTIVLYDEAVFSYLAPFERDFMNVWHTSFKPVKLTRTPNSVFAAISPSPA